MLNHQTLCSMFIHSILLVWCVFCSSFLLSFSKIQISMAIPKKILFCVINQFYGIAKAIWICFAYKFDKSQRFSKNKNTTILILENKKKLSMQCSIYSGDSRKKNGEFKTKTIRDDIVDKTDVFIRLQSKIYIMTH